MTLPHSQSVSALVLAGGESSRMGTDKALLPWNGTPLLQRVCNTAVNCCSAVFVLTPWPERYQSLVAASVQLVQERDPHQGPLVALQQGFSFVSSPWILLLACDMPSLDPRILEDWIEKLQHLPNSILAQAPHHENRWEPLCGFYSQHSQPQLQNYIAQGSDSFQGWLQQMPVQKLAVNDAIALMLRNCNTPEDMAPS